MNRQLPASSGINSSCSRQTCAMGSRGAAPTLQLMVVARLALAAAIFVSTSAAQECPSSTSTLQVTSGRFRLPEGSEDGIYQATVVVDEQGVEQYEVKYLGKGNVTLGSWASDDVSRPGGGRKLLQDGVSCQYGFRIPANDIVNAVNMMANWFGDPGQLWGYDGYTNLFTLSGCAKAYACSYSGLQSNTGDDVNADHDAISWRCGSGIGGWYKHEAMGYAFGRTVYNANIC